MRARSARTDAHTHTHTHTANCQSTSVRAIAQAHAVPPTSRHELQRSPLDAFAATEFFPSNQNIEVFQITCNIQMPTRTLFEFYVLYNYCSVHKQYHDRVKDNFTAYILCRRRQLPNTCLRTKLIRVMQRLRLEETMLTAKYLHSVAQLCAHVLESCADIELARKEVRACE